MADPATTATPTAMPSTLAQSNDLHRPRASVSVDRDRHSSSSIIRDGEHAAAVQRSAAARKKRRRRAMRQRAARMSIAQPPRYMTNTVRMALAICFFLHTEVFSHMPALAHFLSVRGKRFWPWSLLAFVDEVVRGHAQVCLQSNTVSGFFIIAALYVQSPQIGTLALLGTATSTAFTMLLLRRRIVDSFGVFGFNGCLVGSAVGTFEARAAGGQWSWQIFVMTILGSMLAVLVSNALAAMLNAFSDGQPIPVLTNPFNIATMLMFLALTESKNVHLSFQGRLVNSNVNITTNWDTGMAAKGLIRGVGQIYLLDKTLAGVLVLLGILWCSRMSAVWALIASAIGMAIGFAIGVPSVQIYHGLWGYNAALGALMVLLFYEMNFAGSVAAIIVAIVSTCLLAAIRPVLSTFGLPSLTLPFVIGGYLAFLQLASIRRGTNSFFGLRRVPMKELTTPDQHIMMKILRKWFPYLVALVEVDDNASTASRKSGEPKLRLDRRQRASAPPTFFVHYSRTKFTGTTRTSTDEENNVPGFDDGGGDDGDGDGDGDSDDGGHDVDDDDFDGDVERGDMVSGYSGNELPHGSPMNSSALPGSDSLDADASADARAAEPV